SDLFDPAKKLLMLSACGHGIAPNRTMQVDPQGAHRARALASRVRRNADATSARPAQPASTTRKNSAYAEAAPFQETRRFSSVVPAKLLRGRVGRRTVASAEVSHPATPASVAKKLAGVAEVKSQSRRRHRSPPREGACRRRLDRGSRPQLRRAPHATASLGVPWLSPATPASFLR